MTSFHNIYQFTALFLCSSIFFFFLSSHSTLKFAHAFHPHSTQSIKPSSIIGTTSFTVRNAMTPQQLGEFEPLTTTSNLPKNDDSKRRYPRQRRRVGLYNFSGTDPVSFRTAWKFQTRLLNSHLDRIAAAAHQKRVDPSVAHSSQWFPDTSTTANESSILSNGGHDSVIMLQHEPVYTLGTGADESFVRERCEDIDVIRIERGGEVTYHGPGQLTVYPILDLRGYRQDIHWYMRALEEAILKALSAVGIEGASREEDVTGVWVQGKKVAALGIKARRWVTMHGLAVNVDKTSLLNFERIVPCGLEEREVGCVNDFLECPITVQKFSVCMKEALEEVFEADLIDLDTSNHLDFDNN